MAGDSRHISIGRFAGLTGISANTLRRYDEAGLLSPAYTDPFTGYRLYAIEQLDTGIMIRLLRDLDVPLDEVKALVGAGQPIVRTALGQHRERLVDRRTELDRMLARVDAILQEERGLLPYEVAVVGLRPARVLSCRTTTTRPLLDDAINSCLVELEGRIADLAAHALGREIVLYHNVLAWYQGIDLEVCLPIESDSESVGWLLPGGTAMQTLYRGPWDDLWQAYASMLAQIARAGQVICGPIREAYLVDERDTADPQEYVTQITWPVEPRPADSG